MIREEAIDWVVSTIEISPCTRDFVEWLYDKHGGFIANKKETEKIDGMTIMAQVHGMNPFERKSGK